MAETEERPLLKPGRPQSRRRCPSCYVVFVAVSAAISGFAFGYEIGIVDSVLEMASFQSAFGSGAETSGDIVSLFLVGCVLGAILIAWLADAVGRKYSILIFSLVFTVGGVVQALAPSLGALLAGRFVSGVSIGALSNVAPLYISESAPVHLRGQLIAVQQLLITVGIFAASVVNSLLYDQPGLGAAQWQLALGAQCVPGVALFFIAFCIPYSPRWLMSRGREAEAEAVLRKLRGGAADDESSPGGGVAAELAAIRDSIAAENNAERAAGSWRHLLAPGTRWRILLVCALQCFQQWTGINFALYYAAKIFVAFGIDVKTASTTLVMANASLLVIGTLPGIWAVDHQAIGRRPLLLYGGIGMAVSHALVAVAVPLAAALPSAAVPLQWTAVGGIYLFTFIFSATWGPCVWVYQSEALPLSIRAKGTGLATLFNWVSNAIIGKISPLLLVSIGSYIYIIFIAFCAVMAAFTAAYVPETRGVSLEDMEGLFARPAGKQQGQQGEGSAGDRSDTSSGSVGGSGGSSGLITSSSVVLDTGAPKHSAFVIDDAPDVADEVALMHSKS